MSVPPQKLSRTQHVQVSHHQVIASRTTPGECARKVPIEKLSNDVLLKVFRYYLDASPQFWPTLVHICCKWRHIVFESQRAGTIHLRLFCTTGTPVLKVLLAALWPALPINVVYCGPLALDPPASEDKDNIMAAPTGNQSDHVRSISLTVTSSLLAQPSAVQWGPRPRCLHLTTSSIHALPHLQVLRSFRNLVDLQLQDVPVPGNFSLEALTDALFGMAQLRSLSLYLLSTADYPASFPAPQPPHGGRVVLPALTHLNFQGITEHLGGIVVRIDAPHLRVIEVTFFNEITFSDNSIFDISDFINRIEVHQSHRRADIISSVRATCISLTQPGAPTCLKLHLLCEPIREQLSSMALICIRFFSPFLFNVEDLRVSAMRPPSGQDDKDCHLWRGLICRFQSAKWFRIAGCHSENILCALRPVRPPDMWRETVLPSLHKLYLMQPRPLHAHLREAVASFMISHRLSGHHIAVEYERLSLRGIGAIPQQLTIEVLSNDILLNIFRLCLDAAPQFWPTLTWVCQRWRQIVLTSPLGLNLRLHCTHGTPVLKVLDYWRALPIIVQYGGLPNLDPPAPEDDDNIVAALRQSDRVRSISLTVMSSLLEKLSAISEPFSELEEAAFLSRDNTRSTLPDTFRWGSRLRTLHSTGIAFPSFPNLLSPCQDLIDLRLEEVPNAGYFSPDEFANALSGMNQLRSLSLHFLSFPRRRNYLRVPPPPGGRVVLPALTCLKYRGISKYLGSLVDRIDAPRLGDIDITFFSQPTMAASELGRFIKRTGMPTALSGAFVQTSAHAISISFTNSNPSTPLQLKIPCKQLDWQLSALAQVCGHFSPILFHVNDLSIDTTQSSKQDDVDGEQWAELIRAFCNAQDFRVVGVHEKDILRSLLPTDGLHTTGTTPLPSLLNLHIAKLMATGASSWDAVQSLITSRWLSGRPVHIFPRVCSCHICYARFSDQPELKSHLIERHAYQIVCSYCGEPTMRSPEYSHPLFREHVKSKHPEVARRDQHSFKLSLATAPSQFDCRIDQWHGSLRAPVIVAPSPTTTAPHS